MSTAENETAAAANRTICGAHNLVSDVEEPVQVELVFLYSFAIENGEIVARFPCEQRAS